VSCVVTEYVNIDKDCLQHNPSWKVYFDVLPLRDLSLRVDSLSYGGVYKDTIVGNVVNSQCFKLVLAMNKQLRGSFVPNSNRKPRFGLKNIQIDLYVSDTLSESVIENLQMEGSNKNIERGYVKNHSFLYINDYENHNYYLLVNLRSRRAYRLQENVENKQYSMENLDSFMKSGCYQGIRFLTIGGAFSFGDYLMY
jgi:hypothetical protein